VNSLKKYHLKYPEETSYIRPVLTTTQTKAESEIIEKNDLI